MRAVAALLLTLLLPAPTRAAAEPGTRAATIPAGMVLIPAGVYRPFYPIEGEAPQPVAAFVLDAVPVTNAAFLAFVTAHPRWRRSQVPPLFADASYLSHWAGDLDLGESALPGQPVTFVSWFAAAAYCRAQGRRTPSEAEWEFAANPPQQDAVARATAAKRTLAFYARPRGALPEVGATPANAFGVRDLHGVIWEWVQDFNASLVTADNRQDGDRELERYCGGAAVGAEDVNDYASFMRFAFRGSLAADYALHHLGFRCARDLP